MARTFDGSTQYGRNSAAAVVTGYPCSISAWFNLAALPGASTEFVFGAVAKSTGAEEFWIGYLNLGGARIIRCVAQGGGAVRERRATAADLSTGVWYHLLGGFGNSSSFQLYLNGVEVGTSDVGTTPTPTGLTDTWVGAMFYNAALYGPTNGSIAEVGFWNSVPTISEVVSLAKGFAPPGIRPASLAAYYPLIGRNSPEIDIVGARDLTLTATPTTSAHPRVIYPSPAHIITVPAASLAENVIPLYQQIGGFGTQSYGLRI